MQTISESEYKSRFGLDVTIDEQSKDDNPKKHYYRKAFEYAVRTREFEISLYWERAKYFWTFIGATLVAFGVVQNLSSVNVNKKDFLSVIISCLGLLFSFAWYCVNRGSKQWQENWENHVALLEDKVTGPLFKIVLTRNNDSFFENIKNVFIGPGPFSVSKINQLVSVYVVLFWAYLLWNSLHIDFDASINWQHTIPVMLTCAFCLIIYLFARSDFNKKNQIEFDHVHNAMIFKTKIKPQKK